MRLIALMSVLAALAPSPIEAGSLNRLLRGRTVSGVLNRGPRTAQRSAGRSMSQVLAYDRSRDAQEAARRLNRPRMVQRYTTKQQAESYLRNGIPSGTHFTSKATPGPALSSNRATARYGLPTKPDVRVKVVLPPGTVVKSGKVIGGHSAGYGEAKTYHSPLPSSAVKSVTPVRPRPKPRSDNNRPRK
jgi:hypothetical protein